MPHQSRNRRYRRRNQSSRTSWVLALALVSVLAVAVFMLGPGLATTQSEARETLQPVARAKMVDRNLPASLLQARDAVAAAQPGDALTIIAEDATPLLSSIVPLDPKAADAWKKDAQGRLPVPVGSKAGESCSEHSGWSASAVHLAVLSLSSAPQGVPRILDLPGAADSVQGETMVPGSLRGISVVVTPFDDRCSAPGAVEAWLSPANPLSITFVASAAPIGTLEAVVAQMRATAPTFPKNGYAVPISVAAESSKDGHLRIFAGVRDVAELEPMVDLIKFAGGQLVVDANPAVVLALQKPPVKPQPAGNRFLDEENVNLFNKAQKTWSETAAKAIAAFEDQARSIITKTVDSNAVVAAAEAGHANEPTGIFYAVIAQPASALTMEPVATRAVVLVGASTSPDKVSVKHVNSVTDAIEFIKALEEGRNAKN